MNEDKRIEAAFYARCKGIQIPMLALPKVFQTGRLLILAGANDEDLAEGLLAYIKTLPEVKP